MKTLRVIKYFVFGNVNDGKNHKVIPVLNLLVQQRIMKKNGGVEV
jgi:hypothetical protein